MIKDRIMVSDPIVRNPRKNVTFDKMQIAAAIRNSTFDDSLGCTLIDNAILKNCETCNLKAICKGIEDLAQDYLVSTTKVISSFTF